MEGLVAATARHGRSIFVRLLPSVLVAKALWLSVLTLGLCDLVSVIYVADSFDGESLPWGAGSEPLDEDDVLLRDEADDGSVSMTFGLWAYSGVGCGDPAAAGGRR